MINIGEYNSLRIERLVDPGAILYDEAGNSVLLPNKYVPDNAAVDDIIQVFVYTDSEDRPVATTLTPYIELNSFAVLRARDVNRIGAFMDWGLEKDLLIPFKQQAGKLRKGSSYLVYMYLDKTTNRLVGTTKTYHHFDKNIDVFEEQDEVEVLIGGLNDLGLNVVVNNRYQGIMFDSEIYNDFKMGERVTGYVKTLRDDSKLEVTTRKMGMENLEEGAERILNAIENMNGYLALHDKSSPDEIQEVLQMSKKNFKKSLGILYKKRLVKLVEGGIELTDKE
ncbi:MAG: S1-like domain-containing RNA-binding protein [Cyclobacteriaceae bacterium]